MNTGETFSVAGTEEDSFNLPKKEKKADREEKELKNFIEQAQRMIDGYRSFFATFAKDTSLQFKFADGFSINFETGEVNFDASWFARRNFSLDQILWAVLHELSHFRDLVEDSKGVKDNFDYIISQSRKTGAVIMEKWEKAFGGDPETMKRLREKKQFGQNPKNMLNPVEAAAYGMHHIFYNIFDDIYVNKIVSRRAPKYERARKGGKEVEKLYRENLFADADFSRLPRHLQFIYKLIREDMCPGETAVVSEEVESYLNKKVVFAGGEYTPREIIETFLKPVSGKDTKAGTRYKILRRTLEPVFYELLLKDLEEWEPEKPRPQGEGEQEGEGGEGKQQEGNEQGQEGKQEKEGQQQGAGKKQGSKQPTGSQPGAAAEEEQEGQPGASEANQFNPFGKHYKDFDDKNIDQIKEGDIQKWQEKKAEAEARAKEKKDKEKARAGKKAESDKTQDAQEQMDRVWCDKNGVSYKVLMEYRRIQREVEPYLDELSHLWQQIVYGSSLGMERGMEGHYVTGTELDIPRVVEKWPTITEGQLEKADIMKRQVTKEVLVKRPELIRVRLVGDLSGSMDAENDGGVKLHILRQCFVLLLASLNEFNAYLNLARSQTKSKLTVDSEGWVFSDSALRVKNFRGQSGSEDAEQAEIARVFEQLYTSEDHMGGGTYDHTALMSIERSLTPEEKQKIANKKIMEIVFEVTDGGSSDSESARQVVDKLAETGVIMRAFQIGRVSEYEKIAFDAVWNEQREEPLGEMVGTDISALIPAITSALKKYLSGVRL